ncbi:MAG: hypothetical protein HOM21_06945, partial [Halobacteriovoraceae bacterium]|nr:hypothetical protein [Halobacteriovoraceae bacterium]
MSQALLVSDHDVLNDIYTVNLKVYVATNVTIQTNLEDALKILELSPNFDIVITTSTLGDIDSAAKIQEFLIDK